MAHQNYFSNGLSATLLGVALFVCTILTPSAMATEGERPAGLKLRPVFIAIILWQGETAIETAFRETLDTEGAVIFETFDAGGDSRKLATILTRLDRNKYRLIYASGVEVTRGVKERVKGIPVVYSRIGHPVEEKIITCWTYAGCNVTGVSDLSPLTALYRALRSLGSAQRVGVVYDPAREASRLQRDELKKRITVDGGLLVEAPLQDGGNDPAAIAMIFDEAKVTGVLLPDDATLERIVTPLLKELNGRKIPTVVARNSWSEKGGALLAITPDPSAMGVVAADMARKIINGVRATDIHSRRVGTFDTLVNMTTARQVGVTFSPQFLERSRIVH